MTVREMEKFLCLYKQMAFFMVPINKIRQSNDVLIDFQPLS